MSSATGNTEPHTTPVYLIDIHESHLPEIPNLVGITGVLPGIQGAPFNLPLRVRAVQLKRTLKTNRTCCSSASKATMSNISARACSMQLDGLTLKVHSVAYSVPYRMGLVSSKLPYSHVRDIGSVAVVKTTPRITDVLQQSIYPRRERSSTYTT